MINPEWVSEETIKQAKNKDNSDWRRIQMSFFSFCVELCVIFLKMLV